MKNSNLIIFYFTACFILILYLMWVMFKSLLGPIVFAAIFAGAFYPLFKLINKKIKRRGVSGGLTCLIIVISIFLPCIYVLISLSEETITLYKILETALNENAINGFLFGDGTIATLVREVATFFDIDLNLNSIKSQMMVYAQTISSYIFQTINSWVGNTISFLFDFLIMILAIFAIFTEGEKLKPYLLELSPLPDDQEELIISKFNQMNYVTLVCNGLGGIIQGVLAGIAFWIVGINSVILWTVIMMLLAFIPLLGISIIYIPATIYFLLIGSYGHAIFLFTFCTILSLVTENWFKPKFIGKRIQINSLFVLFCIISGMSVYGMAGIFYGPIIGILFLTAVEIYHQNYAITNKSCAEK